MRYQDQERSDIHNAIISRIIQRERGLIVVYPRDNKMIWDIIKAIDTASLQNVSEFIDELLNAFKNEEILDFITRYKNAEVLVLTDFEALNKKLAVQRVLLSILRYRLDKKEKTVIVFNDNGIDYLLWNPDLREIIDSAMTIDVADLNKVIEEGVDDSMVDKTKLGMESKKLIIELQDDKDRLEKEIEKRKRGAEWLIAEYKKALHEDSPGRLSETQRIMIDVKNRIIQKIREEEITVAEFELAVWLWIQMKEKEFQAIDKALRIEEEKETKNRKKNQ